MIKGMGMMCDALKERDAYLHELGGCGDGNCIIERPKGQHTNGGCKCASDRMKMQKFAFAQNRFVSAIRAALPQDPSP